MYVSTYLVVCQTYPSSSNHPATAEIHSTPILDVHSLRPVVFYELQRPTEENLYPFYSCTVSANGQDAILTCTLDTRDSQSPLKHTHSHLTKFRSCNKLYIIINTHHV